jgi:FG-GAP-like repeat
MLSRTKKLKVLCLSVFVCLAIFGFLNSKLSVRTSLAFSSGPPLGSTGAPGETTCTNCHIANAGSGQFTIVAPANYTPGQTYQITVRHQTNDTTRKRWGYQITGLAGSTPAADFTALNINSSVSEGAGGRKYIQHTSSGTFINQTGGAFWTFNWTAPTTNLGAVTLYAAGNQANNDGTSDGDQIYTATATIQPSVVTVPRRAPYDFDGDGKTEIGIFRPAVGEWWYSRSSNNLTAALQFGQSADKITPGDFTGDGKTDVAVFRPSNGFWFVLRSEDGSFFSFPFGSSGDIPAPADYDGDGKTDAAVFRPSTATWFISRSSDGGTTITNFGISQDKPVVADYDGDGKADIAIFRPSVGEWWYQRSSNGQVAALQFGQSTDKPVPADYTGDGKADIAFFRPATGFWFILRSEDNSFFSFPFGTTGDVPVAGDYDGDGKTDAAVFRPSSNTWFVNRTTAGILIATFGTSGDQPIPSAFVP